MPIKIDSSRDKEKIKELIGVRVKIIDIPKTEDWSNYKEHIIGEEGTIIDCTYSLLSLRMDNERLLGQKLHYNYFPQEGLRFSYVTIERLDDPDGNY